MKKVLIESQYLYQYQYPEKGVTVGGTQRYAIEIARFFKSIDWDVTIITKACKDFCEEFENFTIIAKKVPNGSRGNRAFAKKVYKYYRDEHFDLACYSDMNIGFWKCCENSFALQHGISWDNPNKRFKNIFEHIGYSLTIKKYKKVICVDTNYINWVRERSKFYFSNPDRLVYLPNFADIEQFKYKYKEWKKEDEFVLLYPRRLRKMRGYDLFIEMCTELKEMGYNVKPVLAFDYFKEEELLKEYGNNTDFFEINHPKMNQIHELYYRSFLSYVPTRWSEGTSLSAVESMCCGCPVIGTYVGGIGNIILPGFNGDLCPSNVKSLVMVTKQYLDHPELRNYMARNCSEMSYIFGNKKWREKLHFFLSDLVD